MSQLAVIDDLNLATLERKGFAKAGLLGCFAQYRQSGLRGIIYLNVLDFKALLHEPTMWVLSATIYRATARSEARENSCTDGHLSTTTPAT